jgi:hypothetical protein
VTTLLPKTIAREACNGGLISENVADSLSVGSCAGVSGVAAVSKRVNQYDINVLPTYYKS